METSVCLNNTDSPLIAEKVKWKQCFKLNVNRYHVALKKKFQSSVDHKDELWKITQKQFRDL